MDRHVIEVLAGAGIDTTIEDCFPVIPVRVEGGKPVPLDVEVPVKNGDALALVPLQSIPNLFAGSATPPSFAKGPTDEYVLFFTLIERTAVDYCTVTSRAEYDEEFDRLYRLLRRRPDGRDGNPLFSYLQAAVRLYMSLRDVNQQEFEAVLQRLAQSARRYTDGPSSKNYFRLLEEHVP